MNSKEFRKQFGIEGLTKVTATPDHGPCCICQECGFDYEDCKCQNNALVAIAEYVERLETSKDDILGAVARGWCSPANEKKTMDIDLATAITEEVMKAIDK